MIKEDQSVKSVKYDDGKSLMSLVDPWALEGLAKVLTFGAKKYRPWGWKTSGFPYSRVLDSLHRHLAAFERGEDLDPESGLPHIDHIGANWMFLSYYTKEMKHLDDRFNAPRKQESHVGVEFPTEEDMDAAQEYPTDTRPWKFNEATQHMEQVSWEEAYK